MIGRLQDEERMRRPPGLGGVLPKAEDGPDVLESSQPVFRFPQISYTNLPSLSLAEEQTKAQPELELRCPRWLPSQGSSSTLNQAGPTVSPALP